MMTRRRASALMTGLIAVAASAPFSPAVALEQVQIGQVYILHTVAAGGCSELDWHFVVDPHRSMAGFVVCDWLRHTATLSGTLNADDSFQLSVTEVGGNRKAAVTGRFTSRFVTMSIDGADTFCDKQMFKIVAPRGSGLGGGGG
jgi:hypothetical protein